MRRFPRALFALALVTFVTLFPACSTTAGVAAVPTAAPAPAAAAPCPCAAAAPAGYTVAQVVAAPQVAANGVQYVQVQYRVGAMEWTRAAVAIPGNLVVCLGNFIRCATEALFPLPTPSAQLVAAPAPTTVQVLQAPAAAPCAPPAGTPEPCAPPSGKWVWTPVSGSLAPPDASSHVECCDGRCGPPDLLVPPDLAACAAR